MKRNALYLFLISWVSIAQAQNNTMLHVVPPSPESYSLTQAEFSDVNLYTGRNNYSVPLYVIQSGDYNFPISLHYTGGNGIKVSEIASSIGLGWNLSYTGVITRTIRGLADDSQKTGAVAISICLPFPAQ